MYKSLIFPRLHNLIRTSSNTHNKYTDLKTNHIHPKQDHFKHQPTPNIYFTMARYTLSALIALTLALTAHSSPLHSRQTAATCNIDSSVFQAEYAAEACAAINSTITLTGTSTQLAFVSDVAVYLQQDNVNWSGSGAEAKTLCDQILTDCAGTVGVGEMYGASIPTGGDFGGPGIIEIVFDCFEC